ncbi:SAV_2336 N-terminal domain-related protein [Streptomyces sp. RK9]|uniref:SAV_2336 N-terminal domain-related protein n=1 Tax=Streptomyces sp. RK9 TaxID=3239284 RepID=UPI00386B27F2
MTLDRLRGLLTALGPPVTPLDLAEMLWLAERLPPDEESAGGGSLSPLGEGSAPGGASTLGRPGGHGPGAGGAEGPGACEGGAPGHDGPEPAPADAHATADADATTTDSAPRTPRAALHLPRGRAHPGADADDVLVPAPQALRHELAVQRALRPLKQRVPDRRRRVLDEAATAARAAEHPGSLPWAPVLVPATDRLFSLALVVDTGPAMAVWRPLVRELREAMQRTGAFRDVRVWHLADTGTRVGVRSSPHGPAIAPAAVIDPTGRQVVLVLSDCSGPHWWGGRAGPALHLWAGRGPTALLQPLPERLWRRTAAPAVPGRAIASRAGAPNTALRFTPHDGHTRRPAGAVPVPVLELAPEWLADWAGLLMAQGDHPRDTAVTYVTGDSRPQEQPVADEGDLPITERILRFQSAASPTAADLAAHVALSVPALPVMRLIQQRVTPGSRPSDLAEVLLSGLLEPVDPARGLYDFVPGARSALLQTLPRPESLAVAELLGRIGAEIESRAGSATRAFQAVVAVAEGAGSRGLGVAGEPFALVSEEALGFLRGRAIPVVERPVVEEASAAEEESAAVPLPPACPVVSNIPLRSQSFVGRANELQRLEADFFRADASSDRLRVVVVHGMAGVGKTELAATWVGGCLEGSRWWVRAGSREDIDEGLLAMALALNPPVVGALPRSAGIEWAVRWLASHADWVLVLDDVRDPDDVRALLSRLGSSGRVLVTTRIASGWEPTLFAGQVAVLTVMPLGALQLPEAVSLLTIRAGAGVVLDGAAALCKELHCHPAALVQAAANIARMRVSVSEYRRLIGRHVGRSERSLLRQLVHAFQDPLGARILNVLAWLAPEPVPHAVLSRMASPLGLDRALRLMEMNGLVDLDEGAVRIHPWVQSVVRAPDDSTPSRGREAVREARDEAAACLADALPRNSDAPATWIRWRELLPHILELVARVPSEEDTELLAYLIREAAGFVLTQGHPDQAVSMLERAVESLDRTSGERAPMTLDAAGRLAGAYRTAGQAHRAVALYESTVLELGRVLGAGQSKTLALRLELAATYLEVGFVTEARQQFDVVFRLSTERYPQDDQYALAARAGLADSRLADNAQGAVSIYEDTLAECRRMLGDEHPLTIDVRGKLSAAAHRAGDHARAQSTAESTLAACRRVFGDDHPRTIRAMSDLAYVHEGSERLLPWAIEAYEEALAQSTAVRGTTHPETLTLRDRLAAVHARAANWQRAIALYEETLAVRTAELGDDHPETLRTVALLAEAHSSSGAWARAIGLHERVLDAQIRSLGDGHVDTWPSYDRLAGALREVGDIGGAVVLYEAVLNLRTAALGRQHPDSVATLEALARVHLDADEQDLALDAYTQALELRRGAQGELHPDTLAAVRRVAWLYAEAGDTPSAVLTYRRTVNHCATVGDVWQAVALLEWAAEHVAPALGADHPETVRIREELDHLRRR